MRTHYFISGLPRAGSTLLCNLLAQNPRFYVSPATSGCHDVLFSIRNQWDKLIEHQAEGINYEQLRGVMRAALDAYHVTDKPVVIDKGRGWLSLIEMLEFIKNRPAQDNSSQIKILVPVRDISEILASFEQLWRKSTGQSQWAFEQSDYFKSQTVEGRCEIWASQSQPVGLAYNRVKDALARGYRRSLLFVEFDELTHAPGRAMSRIYEFLGEELYAHDFQNVAQVSCEDDVNVHRIPGLHTVRPTVAPVPKRAVEILGPALAQKYSSAEVWRS